LFIVPLLEASVGRMLSQLPAPSAGARALDVGCGGQPFRPSLERHGYRYAGLDVEPQEGVEVDYQWAIDVAPLPTSLAGERFECILCTEVLEHVFDWTTAFANLAHLMAPGGFMIVTVPAVYPPHEEPYDFWRPTDYAIGQAADRAGLRTRLTQRAGGPYEVLGTILGGTDFRPRDASLLGDRAASWLSNKIRWALLNCLTRSRLRRHVVPSGRFYLSNLLVLEKAP
jgi:SAM-dependent methyltransferase